MPAGAASITRSRALVLAAAAIVPASRVRAQTPAPVRVGMTFSDATAEGYYADKGGFFARAGLAANLITFPTGNLIVASVVTGSADVGITNVGSMAAAHSRGLPLYLIACGAVTSVSTPAITVLAVAVDSPIRQAAHLNGKTIGLNALGDLEQAGLMNWIDKGGGDSKSVNFVETPHSDQILALQTRRIDAAILVEPWITTEKGQVSVIARPYDSLGKEVMTTGWVANKDWLEANPGIVRSFAAAMRATARWANANPTATAPMLEAVTKVPRATILSLNRVHFGERIDPAAIQPIIDASARYHFLPHGFAAGELLPPNFRSL
jgi:NitT/TauT family transport system substrate-binding protein